ncbi:MAG: alpha/beta hydrolase [bacterium]|nr:alpha/beta hydrolase [bacterium]
MKDTPSFDYSAMDTPQISAYLFHPRPESRGGSAPDNKQELAIPVEQGASIGANFFGAHQEMPTVLFFHGNGEIVADYNDLAPLFNSLGINFFPVDYRGYGRSTGEPSVSATMKDAHAILKFAKNWLSENGYTGSFIIMGRSLGSASALELVTYYGDEIDGLIIDSGFAYVLPLLKLIGIETEELGLSEEMGFRNYEKITNFDKPTLVIHAEFDHIIPFSDGQALFNSSPAAYKEFITVKGANHNNIFMLGLEDYIGGIKRLVEEVQ